jgi:polysaccharide biosynthesis protein PslG
VTTNPSRHWTSRRTLLGGLAGSTAVAALGSAPPALAASGEKKPKLQNHGASAAVPAQFLMGLNTHLTGPKYIPDAPNVVQQIGANAIRDEVHWATVEVQPGIYQIPDAIDTYYREAAARGLDPLIILDYGNPLYDGGERPTSAQGIAAFAAYARFVAQHFAGVVTRYEVWNEWDIAIGGVTGNGDPVAYVNLLAAVYTALKGVDPSITVVGGAVSTFNNTYINTMLDNGMLDHCDAFSIHTYVYADLPVENRIPEVWRQHVLDLQAALHPYNGDQDFPVYVTELGWTTGFKDQPDDAGVTQELQAAYVARLYLLARTMPFLKGVWLYVFQDEGWTYNLYGTNYGLVRPDLTPKEGYFAFNSIADLVKYGTYLSVQNPLDPNLWALRFTDRNGSDVLALWNSYLDDNYSVVLHNNGTTLAPLVFQQAGGVAVTRQWGRKAWYDASNAQFTTNDLDLTLRRAPMIITGPMQDVAYRLIRKHTFPETTR